MRTVDRVLAFLCAVTAVFALSFAAGRIVGPVGPAVDHARDPGLQHGEGAAVTTDLHRDAGPDREVTLDISGMTCASCAAPDRAQAQQARRRHRHGQLRHREGAASRVPGDRRHRRPARHRRAAGYAADAAARPYRARRVRDRPPDRHDPELAALRQRLVVARRPRRVPVVAAGDGPGPQFDGLAVAVADARRAGRRLGRAGRSTGPRGPTCVTARPRWTRWSRSAARRLRLVAVRAVLRRRRRTGHDPRRSSCTVDRGDGAGADLPRGRRRRHHVPARRALPRGPRQAPRRRGAAGAARARAPRTSPCCATARGARSRSTELAVGDEFVVRPGEKVATDGVVVDGTSAVDASHAHRRVGARSRSGPGDAVVGGARSTPAAGWSSGRPGSAPTPSSPGWPGWSSEAQNGKAAVQRLADRVSAVFVPVVIALAAGDPRLLARRRRRPATAAFTAAVAVLIIACPCALGPGHADRAAGRHRPRRPARHPDQGARGARVHPPRRHRRARQDRHRHHRPDDARRTSSGRRRRRGRRAAPGRRVETASEHPSPRAVAARAAERVGDRCPCGRTSRTCRARRARHASTGTPWCRRPSPSTERRPLPADAAPRP